MADATDRILKLIEQGEKFTYDNFSKKNSRGYPLAYSEDWLVWTHHVGAVVTKVGQSPAANSMARGLGTDLLGDDEDKFESARSLIVSGLKAASTILKEIPASDRIVTLGHNSPEQIETLEKIDKLIELVTETNEFPGSPEDKEQTIAELSAGRKLLEAAKVRVAAIKEVLQPKLAWLAEKTAGAMIGSLAGKLLEYLLALKIF